MKNAGETITTLTCKRLEQIANFRNLMALPPSHAEIEELARIALATTQQPVILDGWVMVPIEPTESMVIDGFESEPDRFFSDPDVWEEYQAMSGCRQAAHRAKLCWAAMVAAAPTQPLENDDRKTLRRLAVILSGSDAPGEMRLLTVTASSIVERCSTLSRECEEARRLLAASQQKTLLSVQLPDPSSKAFWGGSGKNETFYPSTYQIWVKEAIERAAFIAGVAVEVKPCG